MGDVSSFNHFQRPLNMDAFQERYSRQIRFPQLGETGQRNLRGSGVLLIGCGALGSVIANTLVRAGVGFLRLVDRDFLEWSNLQRQVLYTEADVQQRLPKAVAAARPVMAPPPPPPMPRPPPSDR